MKTNKQKVIDQSISQPTNQPTNQPIINNNQPAYPPHTSASVLGMKDFMNASSRISFAVSPRAAALRRGAAARCASATPHSTGVVMYTNSSYFESVSTAWAWWGDGDEEEGDVGWSSLCFFSLIVLGGVLGEIGGWTVGVKGVKDCLWDTTNS